jgi:hypothetical protein
MGSPPEEVTQYRATELAKAADGPLRIQLQILDAGGEVLFEHRCQSRGRLHELKMILWRRVRARTEPLRCSFFEQDNPGSTQVWQCAEPLDDQNVFFYVTVPGGALRVPACKRHRAALEERERAHGT